VPSSSTERKDCALTDSHVDQVGGNAVFINNYNRRLTVRGCRIDQAGSGGVTFMGDPNAVRSPLFEYNERQSFADIGLTPGPKTNNYPADCLVEDCLITLTGRVEKQSAGVGINMAARITIRHCSIYDMPRAGINIGDGCWGGHIVEFCDVFDTVLETSDHGSFNSWGRDRFWGLTDWDAHASTELAFLDVVETIILRNNRWRCDHGWDIDLDDGSSNYHIYNNLCLAGGIKNREGYGRLVENNIAPTKGFDPHVWYPDSQDVFRRNIIGGYFPIRVAKPWGKEVDDNLLHIPDATGTRPARELQEKSGRDENSVAADALFVDPANGDFRVQPGSPALALGFKNFPMDQFGVKSPALRALARTPEIPRYTGLQKPEATGRNPRTVRWLDASLKNIIGLGEISATGLPGEVGVRVVVLPADSRAAQLGLKENDVILTCNGTPTHEMAEWIKAWNAAVKSGRAELEIWRGQNAMPFRLTLRPEDAIRE